MNTDVIQLREFYNTRLGKAADRAIFAALHAIWECSSSEHLLGLGYPIPWLNRFAPQAQRAMCLMPAAQGALQWPSTKTPATVLAHDDEFPLQDASIDRILMAHFLEHAENAHECLNEAWRILSPGGTLVIIVPNRRGVWARFETTPFGTGRPYSKTQLKHLLQQTQFLPEKWTDALYFAPSSRNFSLRFKNTFEKLGHRFWPVFAGVICVSATKRLYQGIPVTARAKRRLPIPVLVPQGTGRMVKRGRP